jgi:hypothetical protein
LSSVWRQAIVRLNEQSFKGGSVPARQNAL